MSSELKITAIETVIPRDVMGHLLMLRIHTSAGVVGCGETYHIPEACASVIHDWMARLLLGNDALTIERHWRFLYERSANIGVRGAEIRALSAIDVALWDILGQVCGQPIYRLLGGPVRDRVTLYNSLGHPGYGLAPPGPDSGWPGYGGIGEPGPLSDSYNFFHEPAALAKELVKEGYRAVKVWCFDTAAHRGATACISRSDIEQAIEPLRTFRAAVGDQLEIMVDGHAFFLLPAALRIADALREIEPLWLEDILKMDNIGTLADFRRQSRMPISVSEMLLTRTEFAEMLEKRAADFVMIDPTWAGGISESMRIANLAGAYNIPVTTHDCTGPLTMLAGLHLNAAVACACYQETVRAHVRTFYDKLIETQPVIEDGHAILPEGPGIGTRWLDEWFTQSRPDYRASQ